MEASSRSQPVRERLGQVAAGAAGAGEDRLTGAARAADAELALADELFAVARLLDGQLDAAPGAVRPVGQARRPGGPGRAGCSARKCRRPALDLVETRGPAALVAADRPGRGGR